MTNVQHPRFNQFVRNFETLLQESPPESQILRDGKNLLESLVATDDWLPETFSQAGESSYRQYLLHLDPESRFSVISFVWGPGQKTPIHNHTVWGLVGILRGQEIAQSFVACPDRSLVPQGEPQRLNMGDVDAISPSLGDLHRVENALQDKASISIHVYGGDIGRVERSVFQLDGTVGAFISGYTKA
jgi:3-mercaptopropionate dioxygenase